MLAVGDILFQLDPNMPFWINFDGKCEYFERKSAEAQAYTARRVTYITQDGEGVLTIECER